MLTFAIPLALGACGSSGTTANAPATTARTSATSGATATDATTAGASASSAATSSAVTTGAAKPGATTSAATPAILQFKAPLLAGGALDGTTYTGKPVAFWFWAPW